jgi:hypothetical protein
VNGDGPTLHQRHLLISSIEKEMVKMAEHYGLPENDIPQRNLNKLALVLGAKTHDEAALLAKGALDSFFITVLWMWAKKMIPGPTTRESLEKGAKQADSLAKMLENKGHDDAAKKQRARAAKLRKEANELREGK